MFQFIQQLADHALCPPRAKRDEYIQAGTLNHLHVNSTPLVTPYGRPHFQAQTTQQQSGTVVVVLQATRGQLP